MCTKKGVDDNKVVIRRLVLISLTLTPLALRKHFAVRTPNPTCSLVLVTRSRQISKDVSSNLHPIPHQGTQGFLLLGDAATWTDAFMEPPTLLLSGLSSFRMQAPEEKADPDLLQTPQASVALTSQQHLRVPVVA